VRSVDFDAFQPKVTLSAKFEANQLGYLTYSTGFRPGGFNGVGQLEPFKREVLRNLEVGYKSTWLDQRLMFNVSTFIARDTDYQFFFVDLAAGGAEVISNLSSVVLKGAEIETQAVLTPGWTAYLNVGLLDSSIRDFAPNLGVPAAIGNKTPKTVPSKFNVGTQEGMVVQRLQSDGPRRLRAPRQKILGYVQRRGYGSGRALGCAGRSAAGTVGAHGLRAQPPQQSLL